MDPNFTKSARLLTKLRATIKKLLSTLQENSDLVIEDTWKFLEVKGTSISELIASTRTKLEAEEHLSNSHEEVSKLIYFFEEKTSTHLEKVERTLKTGDPLVLSKTRDRLGDGFLQGILGKDWNMLPSIYDQMDPLSMSDVIQVHDDQHLHTANSLTDLEGRLKYLETKKYIPDKILLTKIFSDNFFLQAQEMKWSYLGQQRDQGTIWRAQKNNGRKWWWSHQNGNWDDLSQREGNTLPQVNVPYPKWMLGGNKETQCHQIFPWVYYKLDRA